jgi:transcriptional regulator with XRE-family HTH domain
MANDQDEALIKDTARRLKAARERTPYNRREIAERAGISENHYYQIERGEKNPTTSTLRKLLKALDTTAEQFFKN